MPSDNIVVAVHVVVVVVVVADDYLNFMKSTHSIECVTQYMYNIYANVCDSDAPTVFADVANARWSIVQTSVFVLHQHIANATAAAVVVYYT